MERQYAMQKARAKQRGIPFLLTYDEWLAIWKASGHLHERGRGREKWVMARLGDAGSYSVNNVKIIPFAENSSEWKRRLGRKYSPRKPRVYWTFKDGREVAEGKLTREEKKLVRIAKRIQQRPGQ